MFHNILVPLDSSQLAEGVLPHVVALARALDARIILLHVLEQEGDAKHGFFDADRSLLDRIALMQDLKDLLGIDVDVVTPRALHRDLQAQILRDAQPL